MSEAQYSKSVRAPTQASIGLNRSQSSSSLSCLMGRLSRSRKSTTLNTTRGPYTLTATIEMLVPISRTSTSMLMDSGKVRRILSSTGSSLHRHISTTTGGQHETINCVGGRGDYPPGLALKQLRLVSCSLNLNQQPTVDRYLLVKAEGTVFPDDTERFVCRYLPLDPSSA